MRMRRLAVPIAIISALIVLGGVTAGLISARGQAPLTPPPKVMVSPAQSTLTPDPILNHQKRVATGGGRSGRAVSGQGTVYAEEDSDRTSRSVPEPDSVVQKDVANTAENDVFVNRTNDSIIQKQAQHGQNAKPVFRSESGGGLMVLPGASADGDDSQPAVPEKAELKYPNLGSSLNELVAGVEEGEASAKEAAEDAPVSREGSVAVTIYLSGNVDDVVSFLEDNGGSPRNVGEDYIEAYVPVLLLGQVSERPGVIRVREITPPEPSQSGRLVTG